MTKRISILLLIVTCCAGAQTSTSPRSVGPHLVVTDSVTAQPLPIAPRHTGIVTIGAGDSVTTAIPNVRVTDIILLSYVNAKTAEAAVTTVLTWTVNDTDTLTIYGTATKQVIYLILR